MMRDKIHVYVSGGDVRVAMVQGISTETYYADRIVQELRRELIGLCDFLEHIKEKCPPLTVSKMYLQSKKDNIEDILKRTAS